MAQHLFGIQQDGKVRALAVWLTVDGFVACWWRASADQNCWTFSRFFLFVCLLFVDAAVTLRWPPTLFVSQSGDECDESPPASLSVCFVVFCRTHKERVNILLAFLFASVTLHRLLWFSYFIFFLMAAARCEEEDQSGLLVRLCFATPHSPG